MKENKKLTKEQLLKNCNEIKAYWLENAPYEVFGADEAEFMKKYHIDIEEQLIKRSARFASIVKINKMLTKPNYEELVNKYTERLSNKYDYLLNKSYAIAEKKACHWKSEDFESKEAYREYLLEDICYGYGWNNENAYEMLVIDSLIDDLNSIMDCKPILG